MAFGRRNLLFLPLLLASPHSGLASDLVDLPLEDLLTLEITSVAKKRQDVNTAPAAVYVITQEDIRRAPVTRIVDLLRMAPGVQVTDPDGQGSIVSIRGFGERNSNKLLVLVDGRAIYRSVLGGVFWDQVLTPLEEIERIEIVRGPGATLWGANAVNGVINIITKHAVDTQGGRAKGVAGTVQEGEGYGRWGGLIGDVGAYRGYATAEQRERGTDEEGGRLYDDSRSAQAGFRIDLEPNGQDAFTLQGDVQAGRFDGAIDLSRYVPGVPTEDLDGEFFGFNSLARWARTRTGLGDFSLQAYVDHLERSDLGSKYASTLFGLDFQHFFKPLAGHEVVWGASYLFSTDENEAGLRSLSPLAAFSPEAEKADLFGLFAQDEIELLDDELFLTFGARLEHNDATGVEFQPSLRLLHIAAPNLTFWGAASGATRTPARFERTLAAEVEFPPSPLVPFPIKAAIFGDEDLRSESLASFEFGARFALDPAFEIDAALYYNIYDDLILLGEPSLTMTPDGAAHILFRPENDGEAHAWGFELSAEWRVSDHWRLQGAYAFHEIDVEASAGAAAAAESIEGLTAAHQVSLRSSFDVTPNVDFDLWLRARDGLAYGDVPGYLDIDARLAWRPTDRVELSVAGRNLLETRRREYEEFLYPTSSAYVGRSLFATIDVRF